MITILTALMLEAAPLIRHFGLKKDLGRKDFPVFRHNDIFLVVSGVGKVQAAMAAAALLSAHPPTAQDLMINIGFCGIKTLQTGDNTAPAGGCPGPVVPTGTILSVWKVTDMDTGRDQYPDVFFGLDLPAAALECHPIVQSVPPDFRPAPSTAPDRPFLPPQIIAVDMESAGIMAAARIWLAPHQVVLLKIVSDQLDSANQARTAANKARLDGLMTASLAVIDQVMESWQAWTATDSLAETSALPAEDAALLELVAASLRLTVAMRRILAEDLRKARLLGLEPIPCLKAALTEQPKSKPAVRQCWQNLRKEILPNG